MSGILFFCGLEDGELQSAGKELITAAEELSKSMGLPIAGAIMGAGADKSALELSQYTNADIYYVDDARLATYLSDVYVASAVNIVQEVKPDLILFAENGKTSEWVPRLAARMDAALITSCDGIVFEAGELLATKSVSGGAAKAEYAFNRPLQMALLTPGNFTPAEKKDSPGALHKIESPDLVTSIEVLESVVDPVDSGVPLKSAKVVVAGGLGVGSKENWKIIDDAGVALDAGVGGSRAVVDLGWIPPSRQIGFSGLKVRPDVYIAVGISGAVHHLVGITGAKTIVAINKDSEANIFRVSRFGVVGDANEVLPAFVERIKELRAK